MEKTQDDLTRVEFVLYYSAILIILSKCYSLHGKWQF
jgi:hypothetical protein